MRCPTVSKISRLFAEAVLVVGRNALQRKARNSKSKTARSAQFCSFVVGRAALPQSEPSLVIVARHAAFSTVVPMAIWRRNTFRSHAEVELSPPPATPVFDSASVASHDTGVELRSKFPCCRRAQEVALTLVIISMWPDAAPGRLAGRTCS